VGVTPDLKNGQGKSVGESVQSAWIREVLRGTAGC
jgi:hypothetical protein